MIPKAATVRNESLSAGRKAAWRSMAIAGLTHAITTEAIATFTRCKPHVIADWARQQNSPRPSAQRASCCSRGIQAWPLKYRFTAPKMTCPRPWYIITSSQCTLSCVPNIRITTPAPLAQTTCIKAYAAPAPSAAWAPPPVMRSLPLPSPRRPASEKRWSNSGPALRTTPRAAAMAPMASLQCQRSPKKSKAKSDEKIGMVCRRTWYSASGSMDNAAKPKEMPQKPSKARRPRSLTSWKVSPSHVAMGRPSTGRPEMHHKIMNTPRRTTISSGTMPACESFFAHSDWQA
mmetsp:Transcript_127426/g.318135  ORF Transcript_127426/g.318135 Transcript_127426/m.318135 type:complete len:289 (+) Transcript_127426:232-1098(+)